MNKLVPTSKMSLKLSCLNAVGNDVSKAKELYEYLSSDLSDLPDLEPPQQSGLSQIISGADNVLGWIGQHRDEITQGIGMLRSFRSAPTPSVPVSAPPIPDL